MEKSTDDGTARGVGESFSELRAELGARTQEIRHTVGNYVDAHPLVAVGIAFGVGYLLSGALFSRATLKAATLGSRFALGGLVNQLLQGIGPAVILAAIGGRGNQHPDSSSTRSGGNGNGNRST